VHAALEQPTVLVATHSALHVVQGVVRLQLQLLCLPHLATCPLPHL
jgi:hypothetical protein